MVLGAGKGGGGGRSPSEDLGPRAMSGAFSSLLPPGEEACKADSEMAGMGRCRVATGLRLMEVPKSKGTERGPRSMAESSDGGSQPRKARDPGPGC